MEASANIVSGREDLIEYLEAGCRPADEWRIGVEHERILCRGEDLRPIAYSGPRGRLEVFDGLQRFGWTRREENGRVLELRRDDEKVSLEPAAQIEHATAPHADLHRLHRDLRAHRRELLDVAGPLGLVIREIGFEPDHPRSAMDWIPQERFQIMRGYMPRVGTHGLDMMQRTCSIQASYDFSDEADMVRKMRVALAMQPLLIAWCANSRFAGGRDTRCASYRSHVWQHTDDRRCGLPGFVFESGMGFERWVDWALDVPMYSIVRDGHHVDATGVTFRDFLHARSTKLAGYRPTLHDWEIHLPTLTPEVRLKRVVEIRGADSGSTEQAMAVAALFTGILYDDRARDAAWDELEGFDHAERLSAYRDSARRGLAGIGDTGLRELAGRLLALARSGLERRSREHDGSDETRFLQPLEEGPPENNRR